MLALLTTSFIALNNCGNQSGSTSEKATSENQNGPAADYAILPGPPLGYPGVATVLPATPIETQCFNGVDDDGDGLPDCMDPDCSVHPECSQWGPPIPGLTNSAALTVYPNGLIAQEDVVFLGKRGFGNNHWTRTQLFERNNSIRNCFIDLRQADPYYFVPMGEALIASPEGPVGPQLIPSQAVSYFGPRGGLIPICNVDADILMFPNRDDDE